MIKTVFFDLDNVIYNEDLLYFKYFEILWMFLRKQDWNWTFERLVEEREYLVEKYGDAYPHLTIAQHYLQGNALRDYRNQIQYFSRKHRNKYIKIIPGMQYIIRNLNYAYRLGIIANQSREDFDFLTHFKMTLQFSTVAISSQVGYSKPNPEIFLWALHKAKTKPEEAVMVGDRWDEDILPAQNLGMNTVQVRFDHKTKGISPQNHREKLYFSSLENLVPPSKRSIFQRQIPSPTARKPQEILTRIEEFKEPSTVPTQVEFEGEGFEEEKREERREEKSWWDVFKEVMEELGEPPS